MRHSIIKLLLTALSVGLLIALVACNKNKDRLLVPVSGIEIQSSAIALKIGSRHQFQARLFPADASDTSVEWYSEDESVAMIDPLTGMVIAYGLGETEIYAIPRADSTLLSRCKVTVLSRDPYLVGDLYPDASRPEGLVFWIDPHDPLQGKIVSLDESRLAWGSPTQICHTVSSTDGQANLNMVRTFADWRSSYPAFAWCAHKGEGWYLPATQELLTLYEVKSILETIIFDNGDTPFSTSDYWSSTERQQSPISSAVTVTFRKVSENESWASKDGLCHVRAIKAFQISIPNQSPFI